MRKVLRLPWIGYVDNGRAVVFRLSGEGIELRSAVMSDIRNPALALLVDGGLIRAARLQVVETHQIHIVLFRLLLRCYRDPKKNQHCKRLHTPTPCGDLFLFLIRGVRGRRTQE